MDNRVLFGAIGTARRCFFNYYYLLFWLPFLYMSIFITIFKRASGRRRRYREKVERTHTLYEGKVDVWWVNLRPDCRLRRRRWSLRSGRSAPPQLICMSATQEPPGDVRMWLYRAQRKCSVLTLSHPLSVSSTVAVTFYLFIYLAEESENGKKKIVLFFVLIEKAPESSKLSRSSFIISHAEQNPKIPNRTSIHHFRCCKTPRDMAPPRHFPYVLHIFFNGVSLIQPEK